MSPTYEERTRLLWQSLSPADKQLIHGFLMIDGDSSWKFDADKIADLCESHPEIPFALRAMMTTDKRTGRPNESSDDCLDRLCEIFEHAENVARTVSNRFGEAVNQDAYKQIHFRLTKTGRLNGWQAVPVATIAQIVELYASKTTISPPDPNDDCGEWTRQDDLRELWERAKLWNAPRDCGRLRRLVTVIEKELPDNMIPVIKEEVTLAEKAEALVVVLRGDLTKGRGNADQISRQLEDAAAPNQITYFENKLARWDRKRRYISEELQVQEARAKYLRWGGRPLGRFDPFDRLQKGILESEEVVCTLDYWGKWVAEQKQSAAAGEEGSIFNLKKLPAELREGIWELAIRDALNEAARSLPDDMVREMDSAAEGYHQAGCRCHAFWRNLQPFLAASKESRDAVARYTKKLMTDAGNSEDGDIV